METERLKDFRLVGGTALSLYRGHRKSLDLDLFTDSQYGSIDFDEIDKFLRMAFSYVDTREYKNVGPGKSYFAGESKDKCVKLDLFYTDKFIREERLTDGIRIAAIEDIIAMKIDAISRGGRKKDFWDIHELKDDYPIEKMFSLYKERFPFGHDPKKIKSSFSDFGNADEDFDPICLKGEYWEIIKLDLIDFAEKLSTL